MSKWTKLAIVFIILMLLIMVIGLILIATAQSNKFLGVSSNGFNYLSNNSVGAVLSNSAPTSWSNSAWMQLQWGVGFAVIVTPIFLGLAIISLLLGFLFSKK